MAFTNQAYRAKNKEFIPMDELIETESFNNLSTGTKVPLFQMHEKPDFDTPPFGDDKEYTLSRWSSIICNGTEVATVSKKYELIQHQDAFIGVIDCLHKAGLNMQGRVNDFGKTGWLDMVFENMKIQDPSGSSVNLGYSVRNSYDKTTGLNLFPFAVRGICSNGMIFNETPKLKGFMDVISVSHMGNTLSRLVDKLKIMLQNTIAVEGVFIEMFNRANDEIFRFSSEKELELTIASYGISEKRVKEALKRGTIDLENCSRFELYNCLTEYATWSQLSPGLYEDVQKAGNKLLNESYEHTIGRISAIPMEV